VTAVSSVIPRPSEECVIRSSPSDASVAPRSEIWVLAATNFGSGLAAIEGSAVNVALPRTKAGLQATAADLQWVLAAFRASVARLSSPASGVATGPPISLQSW
jgi:hypothetical protein